jgi:hypothetical protein
MTKPRIIGVLILVGVLAVFGAVYQFYFAKQLAEYAKDRQQQKMLQSLYESLTTEFSGTKPEELTQAWRLQVQPWTDALLDRTKFFNLGDWQEHDQPTKEGQILKFWYDEQSNKMVWDLNQKVGEKMGRYDLFPPDIRQDVGAPTLDDLGTSDVKMEDVNGWLERLSFGVHLSRMLLDAKVGRVNQMVMWPSRKDKQQYGDQLTLYTVGLSFNIAMKDFVKMVDDTWRTSERYFNVEALRVTYPYIGYNSEPQLSVELLLTQATCVVRPPTPGDAGAAPGAAPDARTMYQNQNMGGNRPSAAAAKEGEAGFFGKAWKWIKNNYLGIS